MGEKISFLPLIKYLIVLTKFISLTVLPSNAEINVIDFRGKNINLKRPAQRVVCVLESALSGIYMLERAARVCGIPTNVYEEGFYYSETFKYYASLDKRIRDRRIPAVGNWESVNVERVLSLKPDLIIIWSSQRDIMDTFERLKIPVYGVFITKIEDLFKEIQDFGKLLDAERRAEELIDFVKAELKEITKIAKEINHRRRVYFSWAHQSFLQTACRGSIVDEIITLVGGINVCGNVDAESKTLTLERLVALDPEVILMWYSKSINPDGIRKNSQLRNIKAVRDLRIHQFEDTFFFDLWTLKFLYATKFIAKSVYPEYFDFNLRFEKERIVRFLYGIDLIGKR